MLFQKLHAQFALDLKVGAGLRRSKELDLSFLHYADARQKLVIAGHEHKVGPLERRGPVVNMLNAGKALAKLELLFRRQVIPDLVTGLHATQDKIEAAPSFLSFDDQYLHFC